MRRRSTSLTGDRIGNEVRLLLDGARPGRGAGRGRPLGRPAGARASRPSARGAAWSSCPEDGEPDLLILGSSGLDRPPARLEERLRDLGFTAGEVRSRGDGGRGGTPVGRARAGRARRVRSRVQRAAGRSRPSRWRARCGAEEAASRWLDELRHVSLAINGDDLLSGRRARGPGVGRRLQARSPGASTASCPGREAELAAALS